MQDILSIVGDVLRIIIVLREPVITAIRTSHNWEEGILQSIISSQLTDKCLLHTKVSQMATNGNHFKARVGGISYCHLMTPHASLIIAS